MRVDEQVTVSVVGSSSSSASEEAASELQQHSDPLADDDDGITRCSYQYGRVMPHINDEYRLNNED